MLKGQLKDAGNGEDLISASIIVKGTTTGTVSNFDGTFELNVPALHLTLLFSYTGYSDVELYFERDKKVILKAFFPVQRVYR